MSEPSSAVISSTTSCSVSPVVPVNVITVPLMSSVSPSLTIASFTVPVTVINGSAYATVVSVSPRSSSATVVLIFAMPMFLCVSSTITISSPSASIFSIEFSTLALTPTSPALLIEIAAAFRSYGAWTNVICVPFSSIVEPASATASTTVPVAEIGSTLS